MAALASTRLDMCQTPKQTAEMNPSHFETDLVQLRGEQLAGDGLAGDVHGVLEGELDVHLPVHGLQQLPDGGVSAAHVRVHDELEAGGGLEVVEAVARGPGREFN